MFTIILFLGTTIPASSPTTEAVKATVDSAVRKEETASHQLNRVRDGIGNIARLKAGADELRQMLRETQAEIGRAKGEMQSLRRDLADLPAILGLYAQSFRNKAAQYPEGVFRENALRLAAEVDERSSSVVASGKHLIETENDLSELEPFLKDLGSALDDISGFADVMGKLDVNDPKERYMERLRKLREHFDVFQGSLERDHDFLRSSALSPALRDEHRREVAMRTRKQELIQPTQPSSFVRSTRQFSEHKAADPPLASAETTKQTAYKPAPAVQKFGLSEATVATSPVAGNALGQQPPRQLAPGIWDRPPSGALVLVNGVLKRAP